MVGAAHGTSLAGLPEQSVTLRQRLRAQPAALGRSSRARATRSRSVSSTFHAARSAPSRAMAFCARQVAALGIPVGTGRGQRPLPPGARRERHRRRLRGTQSSPATVLSTSIQGAPVNQSPSTSPGQPDAIHALATYGAPVNQTPVNQRRSTSRESAGCRSIRRRLTKRRLTNSRSSRSWLRTRRSTSRP
jgi:hypothetical protein